MPDVGVPQRFDVGRLENVKKTPQGGLRSSAFVTKPGVFVYEEPDRNVREYRPPDEVFHADSLATLPDAPVTVGHPGLVSPDNYQDHAVGHVKEARQDGERVAAEVVIQGRRAIKAIEGGMRAVSCGYACRLDETPGITPNGQPYDRVQREIRYNHVALVAVGRAGSDIRLRLDGAGEQILDEERPIMKVERIDGVEYEVGSDAHKAALRFRQDADEQALKLKTLTDAHAALQAKFDAAEVAKAGLETKLKDATDAKRLDALVKERVSIVEQARPILGTTFKFDGVELLEIKRQVAAKAYPMLKLDEQPEAYIEGLFTAATAAADKTGAQRADEKKKHEKVRQDVQSASGPVTDIMKEAREDQIAMSRDGWKQPLAHTKES